MANVGPYVADDVRQVIADALNAAGLNAKRRRG